MKYILGTVVVVLLVTTSIGIVVASRGKANGPQTAFKEEFEREETSGKGALKNAAEIASQFNLDTSEVMALKEQGYGLWCDS